MNALLSSVRETLLHFVIKKREAATEVKGNLIRKYLSFQFYSSESLNYALS